MYTSETSYLSVNERTKTAENAKLIVQQAEEHTKRKLDLLEQSFELEKQKILDKEFEAKNNADLVALDSIIDELNRSKFESNCKKKKNVENIEQKHVEKHNSLEDNTLKLKEKLTILESHLRKAFEKSSPKPNKSNIRINIFLTNTRTHVDSFIDHLVEGKETLIPHVTQFFTQQETVKQELEVRNLPSVEIYCVSMETQSTGRNL